MKTAFIDTSEVDELQTLLTEEKQARQLAQADVLRLTAEMKRKEDEWRRLLWKEAKAANDEVRAAILDLEEQYKTLHEELHTEYEEKLRLLEASSQRAQCTCARDFQDEASHAEGHAKVLQQRIVRCLTMAKDHFVTPASRLLPRRGSLLEKEMDKGVLPFFNDKLEGVCAAIDFLKQIAESRRAASKQPLKSSHYDQGTESPQTVTPSKTDVVPLA
jgi:hypothetical protein